MHSLGSIFALGIFLVVAPLLTGNAWAIHRVKAALADRRRLRNTSPEAAMAKLAELRSNRNTCALGSAVVIAATLTFFH